MPVEKNARGLKAIKLSAVLGVGVALGAACAVALLGNSAPVPLDQQSDRAGRQRCYEIGRGVGISEFSEGAAPKSRHHESQLIEAELYGCLSGPRP